MITIQLDMLQTAALAMILFLIVGGVTIIQFKIEKRFTDYM